METPNAKEARNIIATLAQDQRREQSALNKIIPANLATSIHEHVGSNDLRNGAELTLIARATRRRVFNEGWPAFYEKHLRPAAADGRNSASVSEEGVGKFFPYFEAPMLSSFLNERGVALSVGKFWWTFSWPV